MSCPTNALSVQFFSPRGIEGGLLQARNDTREKSTFISKIPEAINHPYISVGFERK